MPARLLVALAALGALPACPGPIGPVLGHPWVEDRSVALAEEDLVLTVHPGAVDVDARFTFEPHGPALPRTATFPVGTPGGPAEAFAATLERPGLPPLPLPVRPAAPGHLPVGPAGETFDLELPAAVLTPGARLRVTYRQRPGAALAYVLRSGALWRGPIRRLDVTVLDPTGRVRRATVEGRPPDVALPGRLDWAFRDVEPRSTLSLALSPAEPPPSGAAR